MPIKKEELQIVLPKDVIIGPVYDFKGYKKPWDSETSPLRILEEYWCIHTETGDKGDTLGDGGKVLWTGGKYWVLRPIEKVYKPEGCPKVKFIDIPPIILSENPYIRTHKEKSIEIIALLKDITIWATSPTEKNDVKELAKIIRENTETPEELATRLLKYLRER